MNNNVNSGSQPVWSQEPFVFLQIIEVPKELLFMSVIAINSYHIKNQNRDKNIFIKYSHLTKIVFKKNYTFQNKIISSTFYFCTFLMCLKGK